MTTDIIKGYYLGLMTRGEQPSDWTVGITNDKNFASKGENFYKWKCDSYLTAAELLTYFLNEKGMADDNLDRGSSFDEEYIYIYR